MSSINVLNILRTIKDRGSASRTDLQQVTGLSWGTITNTTRELLNRNLIREEGARATRSGRKPVKLALNPTSHALVGLEIAPEYLHCLALNLAGETLWFAEGPGAAGEDPDSVLARAAAMIADALAFPAVNARICMGIGLALPGALDVRRGLLKSAPRLPGWCDVPVRDGLQSRLNCAVRIEHDPNCLALAERWFGEAGNAENVLCIHLGDGVGMGILLNGEIFRGSQQMAGEFGHITLDPEGPPCACGDRGCVESYCSASAVLAYANSLTDAPAVDSVQTLLRLAKEDHPVAVATFERFGTYLGVGIANLIDLFNPDLVVLAGQLATEERLYMASLQNQLQRHAWPHANRQMLVSHLGTRAAVMGACGMVLQTAISQDILLEELSA
jgi:predicted NBD/HSP70 family sugar kinase